MKTRILLLTQWFEPEPTFKGLVFARELAERGYEVEVVTGFPNYPEGKLYPGYTIRPIQRELIAGIDVTRVALYPSHDSRALHRILNYASFAASSLAYCLFGAKRADVVYVYQMITVGVAAAVVQAIRGTPFVLDVQDIWPDTLPASGMVQNKFVLKIVDRVARFVYRRAHAIVVQSDGFRRLLIDRGVPPEKITLIPNWSDEASLNNSSATETPGFPGPDKFRIVFAGNMGKLQALDTVLDAAEIVRTTHPHITFVLIGGGVETERLKATARDRRLENVLFLPRVGMDQIGGFLRAADAVLVHLKADPLFAITIPGKVQAYMAMGKPILIAVDGDAAALVNRAGAGIVAKPEDASSIASAAIRLASLPRDDLRAMGDRGRAFYSTDLCTRVGVDRFARVFDQVVTDTRSRTPTAVTVNSA